MLQVEADQLQVSFDKLRPRLELLHGPLGNVVLSEGVFLAPDAGVTFRFPRWSQLQEENDSGPGMTRFGVDLLSHLDHQIKTGRRQPPLGIPRVLDVGYDSSKEMVAYTCQTYLAGSSFSLSDVRQQFSANEKQELGWSVGKFMAWLEDMVSVEDYWEMGTSLEHLHSGHIVAYDHQNNFILRTTNNQVMSRVRQRYPRLWNTATELVAKMRPYSQNGGLRPTIFGHYDLRPANLLFNKAAAGWQASAVLDFDVARLSSPEREIRHMALVGNTALISCISAYKQKTGLDVDPAKVYFQAGVHYVGGALTAISRGWPVHSNVLEGLTILYPETDWSELQASS